MTLRRVGIGWDAHASCSRRTGSGLSSRIGLRGEWGKAGVDMTCCRCHVSMSNVSTAELLGIGFDSYPTLSPYTFLVAATSSQNIALARSKAPIRAYGGKDENPPPTERVMP